MKFLKSAFLSLMMLAASSVFAQNPAQHNSSGNITTTTSGCTMSNSSSCVVLPLPGANISSIVITVSGGWSGTLNPIATNAGFPFSSSLSVTPIAGGTSVTTITSNGSWNACVNAQGIAGIYASALTAGTATVTITSSTASVTCGGSSGGTTPSTPGIPSYNGPNIYYAANYGVVAKGIRVFDASWTNSTKTVTTGNNATDTDPCITSAMIGYLIAGIDGATTTPSTTSTNRFGYPATITGVNSCTSFTVTNTPTASCTSSAGNSLCQLVIAPNDDYANLNTAFVAMMGTTTPCNGKLVLPQGIMWVSQPPRGSFTCNADTSSNGTATGYYIEGAGPNSTIIFPAPSGLWTGGGANNGILFYNTGTAAGKGIHLSNFAVDGAGQYASTSGTGYMFNLGQNSSAVYVNVLGTGVQGILCGGGDAAEAIVDHVNSGGNLLGISVGNYCKSSHSAYFWGTGATTGAATFNGNPAWSTNDTFDFNKNTNGANVVLTAGETWMTGAAVLSNSTNNPLINVTNGAILHLSHSKIYNCINGTNGIGILIDSTPSIVYLQDTRVACTATGGKAFSNAGTLYDLGGNIFQTTIANVLTGTLIADSHSIKSACTGVATASQTLGLYGTGPNETTTTCTSTTIGSGIPITGIRTFYNLKVVASAGGVSASSGVVTVLKNGAGTAVTCTIGTGTSCTDGLHNFTTADGDLISIQFTTQGSETLAGVQALVEWQ